MDPTSFVLNLLGLGLQAFGIIIGGLGVVGERFLDYRPMQTLARALIYFGRLEDMTRIPFLRAITQTQELETGKDDRYNKWEVMIVLFIVLLLGLPFVASVYLIPIVYIYRFYIPLLVLLIWIVISIAVDVLPAILVSALQPQPGVSRPPRVRVFQPIPKVPLQFHLPRVNLQRYIRLQLRYFFLVPLQGALMLIILLSQIILNWFAWVIRLDLADKELRGRYYALYSLFALLLGTVFLIVALLQSV
jgi:hypothetical protein